MINNKEIICFHRSSDLDHMIKSEFNLKYAEEMSIFGHAIYFSDSPNISPQLGKYICKFSIKLNEPVLDLNKKINVIGQQNFVKLFNKFFNLNIELDYDDKLYPNIQLGDLFLEISQNYSLEYNKFYKDFIQKLGYNSFKYFGDYHTDFVNKLGDYRNCYGIYDTKNIKFIDGPF